MSKQLTDLLLTMRSGEYHVCVTGWMELVCAFWMGYSTYISDSFNRRSEDTQGTSYVAIPTIFPLLSDTRVITTTWTPSAMLA